MKILNKIQYNAPVVLTFSIISFCVCLLSLVIGQNSALVLFSVYGSPMSDPLFYLRLFLHVLGHVNAEHFFNNFLLILLAGPMIEEKYGSKALIMMIIFTAFITGVIHVLFFPGYVLLGASGIVFMLILLSSFANIKKGMIPLTLIFCVIFYIGGEIINGVLVSDDISQITHIIGGLCGAVFGFAMNRNK